MWGRVTEVFLQSYILCGLMIGKDMYFFGVVDEMPYFPDCPDYSRNLKLGGSVVQLVLVQAFGEVTDWAL
jgi:hypothetical protein